VHKPKGTLGIGISMKLQPGTPPPIRHYREKALETYVTCRQCTLEYAVYGVFAYCPDCGVHNSLQMLQRNLDLARRQVTLAESQAEADFKRYLTENALEDCVSSFDGFARERARSFASKSADPKSAESMHFQNLPRSAVRLKALYGIDLQHGIAPEDWAFAHTCFMKRHLIAHASGVIDEDYLDETKEVRSLLGRRVIVVAADVERLAGTVERIGAGLAASLEALL
jgi:hypothetical protein